MSARSPLPDYKGEVWKGNNDNFQLWYKRFVNFISQPFYYESSQLNPQNQKTWTVSAMALMSFLDTIPECTDVDWNTWDMQVLIDATNAKTPGRITPAMGAQLLKVELDLGEHCQHWSSVQRTLFSVLSEAVSNTSVLDNIDSSTDSFPFSRAMKIFRDRFDLFLSAGQNLSTYETLYRSQINGFQTNLTDDNVEAYFRLVSDVKINIAHTPIQASLSDRYISDTILAGLKRKNGPLNVQALGHYLSNESRRYDLTFLHNRISVEVGPSQLSEVVPMSEVPPPSASPSDAPSAFVADRQPRGGKGGRVSRNRDRQRRDNDAQSSRNGSRNSKQSNREGVPDWFSGDKQQYDRWCFNRRPGGK